MATSHKLSLASAILINLNIMLGAGIFINTVLLAQSAGALGAAAYALVGVLLLPLIFAIADLVKHHQGGNFYEYGSTISPFIGFISTWSYFTAKLASCALGIHVFTSLLKTIFSVLAPIPTLTLDCGIICFFVLLNMLNLRIGRSIQFSFMALKLIPIIFAIISGLYLFSGAHFSTGKLNWAGMTSSIPFVLYAFTGFEASCSLSRSLKNPERDGPRAILYSYALGLTIAILYQIMFFGSLGSELSSLTSYLQAFPALLSKLMPTQSYGRSWLEAFLHIGIASSSLGAAYGIMYSNAWNLFTLAQCKHVLGAAQLTKLNRHNIPYLCVLVEGLFAIGYTLFAQGNQIPLQQISSSGMTITYTLSVLALAALRFKSLKTIPVNSILSIASCLVLIAALIRNISTFGSIPIVVFLMVLTLGSAMFSTTSYRSCACKG